METSVSLTDTINKILLFCGILAALLYLGMDLLAGKLINGYSFCAQSMVKIIPVHGNLAHRGGKAELPK